MRNREKFNAYHREYQRKKYLERREEAIRLLGGCCIRCGATTDLQCDHIDPKQKSFEVFGGSGVARAKWLIELMKCQLLCTTCHQTKSISDTGRKIAKGTHGTLSAYRYCKCEECKEAMRTYKRSTRVRGVKG